MKQILVPLEITLVEDIIKIIGKAAHSAFSNDDVNVVKQTLFNAHQKAIQENTEK